METQVICPGGKPSKVAENKAKETNKGQSDAVPPYDFTSFICGIGSFDGKFPGGPDKVCAANIAVTTVPVFSEFIKYVPSFSLIAAAAAAKGSPFSSLLGGIITGSKFYRPQAAAVLLSL